MLRTHACLLGDAFLDTTPALAAGVHTVVFDPSGNRTGSAVLTLYNIVDVTGTLTVNNVNWTPVTIGPPPGRTRSTLSAEQTARA